MLFDAKLLFSDAQAVTETAVSTNVVDVGKSSRVPYATQDLKRDVGPGEPQAIRIQVVEDFATLTSLMVTLQTDDAENFSSPTSIAVSPAVAVADLKAGKYFSIEYLPHDCKRYLRLNYTVTGTAATAGKLTSGMVAAHQSNAA